MFNMALDKASKTSKASKATPKARKPKAAVEMPVIFAGIKTVVSTKTSKATLRKLDTHAKAALAHARASAERVEEAQSETRKCALALDAFAKLLPKGKNDAAYQALLREVRKLAQPSNYGKRKGQDKTAGAFRTALHRALREQGTNPKRNVPKRKRGGRSREVPTLAKLLGTLNATCLDIETRCKEADGKGTAQDVKVIMRVSARLEASAAILQARIDARSETDKSKRSKASGE